MKDTEFVEKIIGRLDGLSAKMDILVQAVAISPKIETILKDKTKTQQIEILSNLRLSNDAIALIVGTTPETVAV